MATPTSKAVPHVHVRVFEAPAPFPQPHRDLLWQCLCGAMEFDTYPLEPHNEDDRQLPIGRAWVEADQLRAALENRRGRVAHPELSSAPVAPVAPVAAHWHWRQPGCRGSRLRGTVSAAAQAHPLARQPSGAPRRDLWPY